MTITTAQFIAINTGTVANDGTGDDLRTAFTKVNNAFANIADIGFNAANISASGAIEVTGNVTAGNLTATNLYGLIQTPTQSQITSLGTLTGLTSSGVTRITNSTNALQFNSGALIVDGGMGIAKDVYIQGNLYVANALATSVTTLVSTSPLVYFDTVPAYPYNFDIGFYGRFTGAVGNVEQHTGFVRNDADHKWYLFSNVAVPGSPLTTQIAMTSASAKYDTLVLGNIELKSTATTAITNGGTNATGNIGSSSTTFNYGYFANLTGTLQTAAQNNITSASALATVGTITTGKWSSTFGNISGANLTVLTAGNLIGTISSTVMGNSTVYIGTTAISLNRTTAIQSLTGVSIDGSAGSVAASAITGTTFPATVTGSSLTTVGTLTSLSASGNIRTNGTLIANAGAVSTSTATGALQVTGGAGITGNIYAGGNIVAPTFIGNVTGNLTGNVTGNLTVGGKVSATYFTGNGAQLTGLIPGAIVTSATTPPASPRANDVWYDTATDILFLYINDGDSNQWVDISSVALNNANGPITATNATFSGTLTINSGNSATAIINGGTTGVGNIGAVGATFNTIFAKATTAQYADLAEKYPSDAVYNPGTVVVFGGTHEITLSTKSHDPAVAGVISTDPAYLMNDSIDGLAVALTGRVPCLVQGPINKGDRLVSSHIHGTAQRMDLTLYSPGCIIGKSLELIETNEIKLINIAIGRF